MPKKAPVLKKQSFQLPDFDTFMSKVKKMEQGEQLDLSSDEDLSIGIMNLISIEEHLFFTYNKTKKALYLHLLNEVREMRKSLLKRIIKDYEGEVWCISKHLLSSSMRLMEVGTKALTKGDESGAADLFQKSYQLYSLFWGLNLGIINDTTLATFTSKTEAKSSSSSHEAVHFLTEDEPIHTSEMSVFAKMGEFVKKAIDCCRE